MLDTKLANLSFNFWLRFEFLAQIFFDLFHVFLLATVPVSVNRVKRNHLREGAPRETAVVQRLTIYELPSPPY